MIRRLLIAAFKACGVFNRQFSEIGAGAIGDHLEVSRRRVCADGASFKVPINRASLTMIGIVGSDAHGQRAR